MQSFAIIYRFREAIAIWLNEKLLFEVLKRRYKALLALLLGARTLLGAPGIATSSKDATNRAPGVRQTNQAGSAPNFVANLLAGLRAPKPRSRFWRELSLRICYEQRRHRY